MGEYATVNGVELKLGTCDAMYYVRREEIEQAASFDPTGTCYRKTLLKAPGTFWRFPFPAEDGQPPRQWNERDHVGARPVLYMPESPNFIHGKPWVHLIAPGGGHQINMRVPCPYDLERCGDQSPIELSRPIGNSGRHRLAASVHMERWWSDERRYTVFQCIYCEEPFALSPAEKIGRAHV